MMKQASFFILLSTLIFGACKSTRYPVPGGKFTGTFRTCSLDTMVYLTANDLKIVTQFENINSDCTNRPAFTECCNSWPGGMLLFFDKKEFVASYNIRSYKDSLSVILSTDYGTMDYNRKSKMLTFHSTVFNWTRSFKTTYIEAEKTLVLTGVEK